MNSPDISKLLVEENKDIRAAMQVIMDNAQGICFIINKEQKLTGILSDGDIRRLLLENYSLDTKISEVMNRNFVFYPIETEDEKIQKALNTRIRHIPLVDSNMKPLDYASLYKLRQYPIMEPYLKGNELAYVTQCIKTNWISSQGRFVTEFQEKMAKLCNAHYALATSSGTTALHLGLLSLKLPKGSKVMVPNLTFAASINSILHAGLEPVLIDIEPETWNIDPEQIRKKIDNSTKAIMPVHLYGHPCNMSKIMDIAKDYKLYLIEDCAQAIGSSYSEKNVGSFGDIACFSFFGNKSVTTGEGGMVVFKNEGVYRYAKFLRDHGMDPHQKYWHLEVGYNYRMTNLQAAIGVAQLEYLDKILLQKERIAKTYEKFLKDIPHIILPIQRKGYKSTYWLYTILIKPDFKMARDNIIQKLRQNGVDSRPIFYPLNQMPPYQKYACGKDFPISQNIAKRGISLPSFLTLRERDINHICLLLKKIQKFGAV